MRFDVCHIPPPYLYIRSRSLSLTLRRKTTSLREETQTNKHGRQSAAAVFRSFESGAAADVAAAAAALVPTNPLAAFRYFPAFLTRISLSRFPQRSSEAGSVFLSAIWWCKSEEMGETARRSSGSGGGGKRAYGF